MPAAVQLLAGPARSGKTRRLLAHYRQRLAAAQVAQPAGECFWLAPNHAAVRELRQSLVTGSAQTLLRPNLHTFARFAETLITRGSRRIRSISPLQKKRLLQHAVHTVLARGQLDHYARVAETPGFVAQIDEFIAELKRQSIWPEDLLQRERLDRRGLEMARIYAEYQRLLHGSELYDAEGRFWAAREILAESVAAGQQAFDLVVVNGFNDFTVAQYGILQLLSACSAELVISLTVEGADREVAGEGELPFAKRQETLSRLRKIFPRIEIESLAAEPSPESPLRQLQSDIFRETPTAQPANTRNAAAANAEIVAASSAVGEVEAVAQRMKKLLLRGATKPQEVVVVCQGGESMATLVEAVFRDYGIPFDSELRPRLEAEPLVRTLDALLRLHAEDWPFQTLLEVIGNRLLTQLDGDVAAAAEVALQPRLALEMCARSAQLPSGKQALLEQLEYRQGMNVPGDTDPRAAQLAVALEGFRLLDALLSELPARATLETWVQAIGHLLRQLQVLSPRGASTSSASRCDRAWRQLRSSLQAIARVDAWGLAEPPELSLEDFRALIRNVARNERVPSRHDGVGRVRVLSAESARKLTVPHLFLMGLSEQAFATGAQAQPAAPEEDGAGLLENLAEIFTDENADPNTDPADPAAELQHGDGMLLFYELVTRATESLTLSYTALDAKGQTLSPSPFLTDMQHSVGAERILHTTETLGEPASAGGQTTPLGQAPFRRGAVAQALGDKPRWLAGMLSQPQTSRTGHAILSGIECVAQRAARDHFGPFEGLLLSETAQAALAERFGAGHLWSPSRLESYATCPFRYFAEQILKLEPLSELTLSNDARRRGSLLHQVLAKVHQQLSQLAESENVDELDTADLVRRFVIALDEEVRATPLRGIDQSLREIERREIEAWAPKYAEQEKKYREHWAHLDAPPRPRLFEVRFGSDTRGGTGAENDPASTADPFELDLGREQIRLTGQIDRVDLGRVGGVTVFNIIDYKSGKKVVLTPESIRSGHQLQLPLYALAAEQLLLAEQQAVALATGYWNIKDNGFQTGKGGSLRMRELNDEALRITQDWEQLQPDILLRVQQLIDGMRRGQFPVYNEDQQCTRSCDLSTICRVGQIRSLEKVWPPEAATNEKVEGTDVQ